MERCSIIIGLPTVSFSTDVNIPFDVEFLIVVDISCVISASTVEMNLWYVGMIVIGL